jgi:hypothetical protein
MSVVASCRRCGAVNRDLVPVGRLGDPVGPCLKCGRLMFWMAEPDLGPLASERRFAGELRDQAARARATQQALGATARDR